MPREDLKSDAKIQTILQEGRFVARGLYVGLFDGRGGARHDLRRIDNEMRFLEHKKYAGAGQEVERFGQRGRSATIVVPGVDMELFHDIGLVYDGDASTIRAYMFHDTGTITFLKHDRMYNVSDDKKKFEPILSKIDFMNKYKGYREKVDYTEKAKTPYNEVIGNFFSESLLGLVGNNDSIITKLKLLLVQSHL